MKKLQIQSTRKAVGDRICGLDTGTELVESSKEECHPGRAENKYHPQKSRTRCTDEWKARFSSKRDSSIHITKIDRKEKLC